MTSHVDPMADQLLDAAATLATRVDRIDFSRAAARVYNPLRYAWEPHADYVRKGARRGCRVVFLGMNPGPWGMAQTGVPFGEIAAVRDWLKVRGRIDRPPAEHPKRPVEGFACPRSEVSGRRLWGLFRDEFGTPSRFFRHHFVANYCPLLFMEPSGRNITPDKLPADLRRDLEQACDSHLAELLGVLAPEWVVGVGGFAEKCARRVLADGKHPNIQVARILHPSPASPAANRDWAGTVRRQLVEHGIW